MTIRGPSGHPKQRVGVSSPAALGYSKELAAGVLAKIRTDMDTFSDDEIAVLENHGYTLADAAYRAHVSGEAPPLKSLENRWWPSDPLPAGLERELRAALADSAAIHLLGH